MNIRLMLEGKHEDMGRRKTGVMIECSNEPSWERERNQRLTLLEHVTQSLATHFDTDEAGLVENLLHLGRDEQASIVIWAC